MAGTLSFVGWTRSDTTRRSPRLAGLAALMLLVVPLAATAQERTIVYTGALESDGTPVNAATDFNFALFACEDPDADAACARPLWVANGAITSWDTSAATPWINQWPAGGTSLVVSSGRFSVRLGDTGQNPLPADLFDNHEVLFLAIRVGTVALSSLQRIETVPFAVRALDSPDMAVEVLRVSPLGLEVVSEDGTILLLAEDGNLEVTGGVEVGDTDTCEAEDEGRLRWRDGAMEVCDGVEFGLLSPPGGALYTRWGRTDCPEGAELQYSGWAAAAEKNHTGSTTVPLCMSDTPTYLNHSDGDQNGSLLYAVEFGTDGYGPIFVPPVHYYEVTCAVCLQPAADLEMMVPGTHECPAGWREEYAGYLMGNHYTNQAPQDPVCVDATPSQAGSNAAVNQGFLYPLEMECQTGIGPCLDGYVTNREVTCAVCTR